MSDKQFEQIKETNILCALVNTTIEQAYMIDKNFNKGRRKQLFNNWLKMGERLINDAGFNRKDSEYLDQLSDIFHNHIQTIRENTLK